MPYFDPKFSIVKPEPTVDDYIKSFRASHYFYVGGITSGSWVYGFIFGKPARFPTASVAATLGFSFAAISIRGSRWKIEFGDKSPVYIVVFQGQSELTQIELTSAHEEGGWRVGWDRTPTNK